MATTYLTISIILTNLWVVGVTGWDADDLEVFDLVEEVGKNFYQVLTVPQDASQGDIRKAYRRLSLQLHPDHNKEADAEDKFRQLVGIYEILKDETKRRKYDHVLQVGLPDWRQPIFYYRRVRKFGLLELGCFLFVIVTLGQYAVAWSVYLERKYATEGVLLSKLRKRERKARKGKAAEDDPVAMRLAEEVSQIQKPNYLDLLPFAIFRGLLHAVCNLPNCYRKVRQGLEDAVRRTAEPSEDGDSTSREEEPVPRPRRRKLCKYQEMPDDPASRAEEEAATLDNNEDFPSVVSSSRGSSGKYQNRIWFDEDIKALTKAMVKYPVGTVGRWDIISDQLERPVGDVVKFARTLKLSTAPRKVAATLQGVTADTLAPSLLQDDVQVTCRYDDKEEERTNASGWSQEQQKALEVALTNFPKGVDERWDKIAASVPNKTKEECIARYKQLAEIVRRKRESVDR